ncbi:MAG: ShlB/FhaC/HecB family hemolysin secretion/activation protein [Gammaproteobacteria bacterium]
MLIAAFAPAPVLAQAESRTIEPSRQQPSPPTLPRPLDQDIDAIDPAEQPQPPTPRPSDRVLAPVDGIFVYTIEFEGNTVFTDKDLEIYAVNYEDRVVAPEELQILRRDITQLYRSKGYANSGVILPDQKVENGIVTLKVIEGKLADIEVFGNKYVREGYVDRRVGYKIDEPLNVEQLKNNLNQLQQDPLIAQVNSELRPGLAPGEDILRVRIEEDDRFQTSFSFDNYRSPTVDEYRGTVFQSVRGPFGIGDIFNTRIALTGGSTDLTASYVAPFTAYGATVEAYVTSTDSSVEETDLKKLGFETESKTYGLLTSWPVHQSASSSLTLLAGAEKKTTDTTSDIDEDFFEFRDKGSQTGFSVIPGIEGWIRNDKNVFAGRLTMPIGLDAFDSTQDDDRSGGGFAGDPAFQDPCVRAKGGSSVGSCADSDFVFLLGQGQYLRLLGFLNSQFIARTTFQYTFEPLMSMYKLSVGGRYSVRGFREGYFTRDNGLAATAEWQVPLFVDANTEWLNIRGVLFSDYGYAWDDKNRFSIEGRDSIWSAGVGVLWNPLGWLKGELFYGLDLKEANDRERPDDALQDDGIHFQLQVTKTF